jgi:broad specificity phosphatase PhoE
VTRTKRSRDTASALLAVTGLEPIEYPPKDVKGLVERLRARRGEHVLIVGHSNTIPELLAALGITPVPSIADEQYGDMWVVELRTDKATVELRRYGENHKRFGPQQ